jgi:hypothetical protein
MAETNDPAGDVKDPKAGETRQDEHDRVRSSNDRDQELEREGETSAHNRGYDNAVDNRSGDAPPSRT